MSNQNQENKREQSQNPQHSSQANNPQAQPGQQPNQANQNPQGSSQSNPLAGNYQGSEAGSSERDLRGQDNLAENQKPVDPSAASGRQDPTMGQRSSGPGAQNYGNSANVPGSGTPSSQNPQSSTDDRSGNLGSTRKSIETDEE